MICTTTSRHLPPPWVLFAVIGFTSFTTLINLFGPQALAPELAHRFDVTAPQMGIAINAATIGMAVAGVLASVVLDQFDRKLTMTLALVLLSIPTALLALSTNIYGFALLRIVQGLLMCTGFGAAIAYVAEEWGEIGLAPAAMGAYLTGNVAANMLGRVIAGAATAYGNWRTSFIVFTLLNIAGAVVLRLLLPPSMNKSSKHWGANSLRLHLVNPALLGTFMAGFLILFVFIGVFTYVNFRLALPPFQLSSGSLGLTYLVFCPALLVTAAVGWAVDRFGNRLAFVAGALTSFVGAWLTVSSSLPLVLVGMALVGSGLFFCQALATGFTGHTAAQAKGAAGSLYLGSYFIGGLCGAWIMGEVFDTFEWTGCALTAIVGSGLMALIVQLTWTQVAAPHREPQSQPVIIEVRAET
jgi:YNFM family putative membrane transporter